MSVIDCRIKGYIQPFERHLAIQELRALTAGEVVPIDGSWKTAKIFRVAGSKSEAKTLHRDLAYWETVDCGTSQMTV